MEENLSKTSTGKGEEQTQNETSTEQDTSNQNNTDPTKPSSGDNKMSSEDVDALVDQDTQGKGENNNSEYVARKHELNPYGMTKEEFDYFRNMDRNNEDVISNLNFNVKKLMELNKKLKNIEKGVHHE